MKVWLKYIVVVSFIKPKWIGILVGLYLMYLPCCVAVTVSPMNNFVFKVFGMIHSGNQTQTWWAGTLPGCCSLNLSGNSIQISKALLEHKQEYKAGKYLILWNNYMSQCLIYIHYQTMVVFSSCYVSIYSLTKVLWQRS